MTWRSSLNRLRASATVFAGLSALVIGSALAPGVQAANTTLYWDTNGASAGTGGTGMWDTTSSFWSTDPTGSSATTTYNNTTPSTVTADFGGTAGTVTLATGVAIYANALQFDTTGYTIAGGSGSTLNFTGTAPAINLGTGLSETISANMVASSGLTLAGNGTLSLSGTDSATTISLGVAGANNTLNFTGGATTLSSGTVGLLVGGAGGSGVVNQTGGTVAVSGNISLGDSGGGYGNYNISTGATLNVVGIRNGGYNGNAANGTGFSLFNVTGGIVNNSSATVLGRGGNTTFGSNVNVLNISSGQYNQTGGNVSLGFATGITGILNISGGSLTLGAGAIFLGTNGSSGILNLDGGVTQTQYIAAGGAFGTGIVNFNGGTLQANQANAGFMTGLTSANIFSGGATIDTNAQNITVGQALLAPAGSGLSSITLGSGGSGYIGAPVVVISGGGGTGATAVANINSSGVITGFTITSPGTGYTSAPTVTLQGGGGTGATTTSAIAANTSGGLTKIGAGTLTLSAINTYTGGTTVNAGTLALANGGGAGAVRGVVTVNSGATLSLTVNNALGYTAGTQVSTLNINGGTVSVSGNNGDEGYLTSFNLTGGTMAYATTNGSAYQIAAGDATAPKVTSNASSTTSLISGGLNIRSGNLPIVVASGSTTSGIDLLISGPLTGGAPFTKSGTGLLALTGANTYSSATISAGTLAGTTTSLVNNITDNAALVFDQTLPANALVGGTALATGTYAGVISGTGTVAKNNAGIVILSNANTYQGATAVNGGILYDNGSLNTASAVSVASGARFGGTGTAGAVTIASGGAVEGGQSNAGKLTLSGLTFSGSGTAYFGNLSNYTSGPAIAAGALTASGGPSSVALTISGAIPGLGTYQLISYTGTIGGTGQSAFALTTPLPNRATGSLDFSHAGLIDLTVSGADFLIWTGATNSSWDTTNPNFKLNSNGQAATYIDNPADSVVFDDSAGVGKTTINLTAADVHPTSVTFNDSTLNYTVQGTNAIAGTTGLTKNGTGTLTITNANTYTGATTFGGGVINAGSTGALGTAGTFSFTGGTLQYSAANTTDYSARFNAAAGQLYSVDTNGQTVNYATALTSSGGSLTKKGAGTLTLSTFETYTGGTTVSGGTLSLNTSGGSGTVQGAITVNSGATLNLAQGDALGYNAGSQVTTINVNGGNVTNSSGGNEGFLTSYNLTGGTVSAGGLYRFSVAAAAPPTIASSASATTSAFNGNVDDFGTATNNLGLSVATGTTANGIDLQISGVIQGGGGIAKTGSGYLNLTGQNTFTGPVNVTAGTLNVGAGGTNTGTYYSALGVDNTGKAVTVSSGATLSGTVNNWFGSGSQGNLPTITLNGGTLTTTRYSAIGALSLNGGTVKASATDNSSTFQAFALTSSVTVAGSAPSTITSTNVTTTTGGYHLGNNLAKNTTFTVSSTGTAGSPDLTVSAPLLDQSGDFGGAAAGLTLTGTGSMALTAINTYTGPTAVNSGTLLVTGSTAAGAVTVGTTGGSPTTGTLAGTGTVAGTVTVNTGSTISAGNVIQSMTGKLTTGALTLSSGTIFNALLTSNSSFSTLTASNTSANATSLNGDLFTISTTSGATFTPGTTLDLITSSVTGTFTDASYTSGGYTFTADYTTNPGNFDVDITAVPEPATWAAGAALLLATGWQLRRRLRNA